MLLRCAGVARAERPQRAHQAATRSQVERAHWRTGRKWPPVWRAKRERRLQGAIAASEALCLLLLVVILPAALGQRAASNATIPATPSETAQPETAPPPPVSPNGEHQHPEPTQASQSGGQQQQQQNKLKAVNFTLVDELFESTLNDDELVKRWRNMDAQFQEGIRSILKLVFPQIVALSQDAKVSGDCSGAILKWILSLRNLRSWAIKMLDATGKPTSGIFEGSLTMFGNYRQCLSIRAPDEDEIEITDQFEEYFRGQFCVLHLRPWLGTKRPFYNLNTTIGPLLRQNYKYYEKTLYDELAEIAIAFNFIDIRLDLCVPSTCTMADIQRVANLLSRNVEMRAKVMRCDIEPRDSGAFLQSLDLVALYWLMVPAALLALTLLATLLVLCGFARQQHLRAGPFRGRQRRLGRLLRCLSIQGALEHLLAGAPHSSAGATPPQAQGQAQHQHVQLQPEPQFDRPLPLYGLRNLFILWFVVVQLTVELNYQYLRDSLLLRNMLLSHWPFQVIINTSMIFESLILITAFTFGYAHLESSARQLAAYALQKYVRLIPSIVAVIAITIVTPAIGLASPVWKNFVDKQAEVCRATGYLNLFFLQNFVPFDKVCLPHTWLFCVEFQLLLLTIPLVLLLKRTFIHNEDSIIIGAQHDETHEADPQMKHHKPGGGAEAKRRRFQATLVHLLFESRAGLVGALLVLTGVLINFALVHSNQLPPAWFHTFPDAKQKSHYFSKYLTKAWTHLSSFVIGLYAGHLCRATIQLSRAREPNLPSSPSSPPSGSCASSQVTIDGTGRGSGKQVKLSSATRTSDRLEQSQFRCAQVCLELAALACLLGCIFSTFAWSTGELPGPLASALFDSLARLVWSLALAGLMVKLCLPERGQGCGQRASYTGLSRLLSQPVCLVLGRLSFLAYLLAPLVHTLVLALQEQSLFPSLYLIFHVILGNIVITYLTAFVVSILIEQPVRLALGQLIWRHPSDCEQSSLSSSSSPALAPPSPSASNTNTTTSSTSLAG